MVYPFIPPYLDKFILTSHEIIVGIKNNKHLFSQLRDSSGIKG
jgi:hypothetical protein